ncbi:hypothetical protein [Shewanella sp. SR44-3]|uniref:hypothetical protein n=1 Tax=Shewanella sp. SR44-3 TaxID=2760936 RepID=UPI0015FB2022|nr:hypothetical protein [Shewanella sp. SR44-3]MBB1269768.1 hypothetical protein [Shewanella sp. SR44-3]
MRAVVCSLLVIGAMNLAGCAATPNTFATKIKAQGEQHLDLSQQWEQGLKDVNNAKALLTSGQKLISEGKTEIFEGEKLITEARAEAQRQRNVFIAKAGSLSGAQSGIHATKLTEILEDIADLWEDADEKFVDGKELIEEGNTKVAEGESALQQGQTMLGNGRSRMQQAETKYQERTGQGLVEQMHIEEQSRNF